MDRCSISNRMALCLLVAMLMLTPMVAGRAQALSHRERQAVQSVLDAQIVAWNHGDLNGFMVGYWNSPDLVYWSHTTIIRGWQPLLDLFNQRFKSPSAPQMGALDLATEEFTVLAEDVVLVWGTFRVTTTDGKQRCGLYTLAMRKLRGGWRTVYDRTSNEPQSGTNSGCSA